MVADAAHSVGFVAETLGDFDHHFGMFERGGFQVGQGAAAFERRRRGMAGGLAAFAAI